MERTSTKHGPMLDDEMERETASLERGAPVESRAREERQKEPPGEEQPVPETAVGGEPTAWQGQDIDRRDVHTRERLAQSISLAQFPAGRTALLECARDAGATDEVVGMIERLPAGRTFENVEEVWEALGGVEERRF